MNTTEKALKEVIVFLEQEVQWFREDLVHLQSETRTDDESTRLLIENLNFVLSRVSDIKDRAKGK